ncbi:phosphate transport system regulatory protein PhoU [Halobacteriales archaeon QS_4_70_19]|nr:MAG: phosphate transport system regulatory protein PhoU [Halobacteriales archaeon QS_4_70_19]
MPRESYQSQLEQLREDVLYMSEIVTERFRSALSALERRDEETAWEVIEGDDEINQLYLELEQDCIDLLALQQPVASDLRFIAASFKIITDLERIADLATNIGDYTLEAGEERYPDVDVQGVGDDVLEMVKEAMAAYAEEDPALCRAVAARDDEVDAQCERASDEIVRSLIETELDDPEHTDAEALMDDVSRLLLTIRDLERVGDHAVNIAARALYMIENDDELIY